MTCHLLPEGFWRPRQPFKILLCCLCSKRDKELCNRSCPKFHFLNPPTSALEPRSLPPSLAVFLKSKEQHLSFQVDDLWKHLASEQDDCHPAGRWLGTRSGLKDRTSWALPQRLGLVLPQTPHFTHLFIRFIGTSLKDSSSLQRKPAVQESRESLKKQGSFMNPGSLISRNRTSSKKGPRVLQAPRSPYN